MNKICKHCKQLKPLGEFFQAPADGAANWQGTGIYCKQCHSEGKIVNGYGWQGKYQTPESV